MKALRVCILAWVLMMTACSGDAQIEVDGTLAIVNGMLIDGTGSDPILDAVVIVDDDVIVAVGSSSELAIPESARVIDARGGTILPGLVDTHTHHLGRIRYEGSSIEERSVALFVELPLEAGITTFRDAGSPYGQRADLGALRSYLAGWDGMLPTVVVGGPILALEGSAVLERFSRDSTAVADAAAAAALTASLLENGVDQIKIMLETDDFSGGVAPSLGGEEIAAITAVAREHGAYVFAHVSDVDEARLALQHGVDELTHWPGSERIPDDVVEALADGGVFVGTTFSIIRPFDGDVRRLVDAGVRIVVSTDAPGATPVTGIAGELHRMVEAGMTPMETIVAATRDGAEAVGVGAEVGTIEVGKIGDIVVVGGDPLANIATISNVMVTIRAGVVAFES